MVGHDLEICVCGIEVSYAFRLTGGGFSIITLASAHYHGVETSTR
jgi:hypothetical protein